MFKLRSIFIFTLLFISSSIFAEAYQNLLQPIGTITAVEAASVVNQRLVDLGSATNTTLPFESTTDVTTIMTSETQIFVRMFSPPTIGITGSWIAPRAALHGQNATQIENVLALPAMPTKTTTVIVPAGVKLYTGLAGAIANQTGYLGGAGGAQQSKLITFTGVNNTGEHEIIPLCYSTIAPDNNVNQVADYLNQIPYLNEISSQTNYDLYKVIDALDLLYVGSKTGDYPTQPKYFEEFYDALKQISPLRYDDLATDAVSINVMYNDMVNERITTMFLAQQLSEKNLNDIWLKVVGSSQHSASTGFDTKTGGVFPGFDRWITDNTLLGFSGGIVRSNLNWSNNLGNTKTNFAMAGLYAAWFPNRWFVQGGINAGVALRNTDRNIIFSTLSPLSRTANSSPNGFQENVHLRTGYHLPFNKINIAPIASIDYFCQRRNAFNENGANSLNLQVDSATNHNLRSQVGLAAAWNHNLVRDMVLTPQFQAGWTHLMPLDNHAITASLLNLSSFTVHGDSSNTNSLTTSAGLYLTIYKNFYVFINYNGEYKHGLSNNLLSGGVNYKV
jgi:outer membrane autotransporter protein